MSGLVSCHGEGFCRTLIAESKRRAVGEVEVSPFALQLISCSCGQGLAAN